MAVTFNYLRSAEKARVLIEKYGNSSVRVYRKSRAAEDVDKPWRGPDSASDEWIGNISVHGVLYPFNANEAYGTLIRLGDHGLYISPKSFPVSVNLTNASYVVITSPDTGEERFKVVDVSTIKPGDETILYDLHLRK